MAFDGNGTFDRLYNWSLDALNNIDITASRFDGEDNDFAAGLTLCVTRDGQGKMAADFLPSAANTYNIGSPAVPWGTLYATTIQGNVIYTGVSIPQTAAELAAGVTPAHVYYGPGYQLRYNTLDDALKQQITGGAPVISNTGGMVLYGSIGSSSVVTDVRPEGQLILANSPTSGHAILSMAQQVAAEEAAWESVGYLDNAAIQQQGAWFWRWLNSNNVSTTFESLCAVHLTGYQEDNTPLILWGGNRVRLCGPSTTALSWNSPSPVNWVDVYTSLLARTSLVAGSTHAYSTASSYALEVAGNAQFGDVDGSSNTNNAIQLGYSTGGVTAFFQAQNNAGTKIPLLISASAISVTAVGGLLPSQDNSYPFGSTGKRWTTIFAVTGTINTSDGAQKTVRNGSITDAERRWGAAIKGLVKAFQWNDAIAVKGDTARIHFGVIAQEVEKAGIEAGIPDPLRYAFLCRDPATKHVKKTIASQRQKSEEYSEDHVTIEERNGKHIRLSKPVIRTRPVYDEVPVHDESGAPILQDDYERDADGNPIAPQPTGEVDPKTKARIFHPRKYRQVQVTHRIPVMETFEEEVDAEEPVLNPDGTPVYQYGVRYDQLLAFVIATLP